ncbi:hypothetical protein LWF15_01350 [Kineosporia rhizophila]|uniref:hypothetical protein n=1 Tax=Kineosporia rhizophila TaxID=84633 RepID=UPI001E43FC31|nr:hypothetical protein [Kineosporia rhizophila]MCE0534144.1 hypothetical protein [Kineosporia rhizophila]
MATALVAGVAAAPGQAASSYTVPISLHPVAADLHLVGASEAGVAVQQADPTGQPLGQNRPVFTGALGGELEHRPQVGPSTSNSAAPTLLAVSGTQLAWYENLQRAGSQPKVPHRLNILTGQDVVEAGQITRPDAFNGEGWFSDLPGSYANVPSQWRYPLVRHRAGTDTGQGMQADVLMPHVPGVLGGYGLAADRTSVLRTTLDNRVQPATHVLDLVVLKTGAVTRIAESPDEVLGLGLSEGWIVWATKAAGGGYEIHQKPRAGGAVTHYAELDPNADVAHLAVGAAGVGYLINHPDDPARPRATSTTLAIVNGPAAKYKALPYDASGLAAVGNHFLTASSGTLGPDPRASVDAGVYRVTADEFTRVATVPQADLPPAQLSLSAGQVRYVERSSLASRPVYQRRVSSDRRATFSAETSIAQTSGAIAFSGARGVVGVPGHNGRWQLIDRGKETGDAEAFGQPNQSGAYTLIGGKAFRPDGKHMYTQPVPSTADDLFGPNVVYVETKADGSSTVWLDDAEKKTHKEVAKVAAGCDGGTPLVTVWGELGAWSSSCGDQIHWKNLNTGQVRQVPTQARELARLSLSEGTLTWSDSYTGFIGTRVMDLTTGNNAPVVLDGRSALLSIDDHQIARLAERPPSWSVMPRAELSPLPFQPKYRPRLISTVTPLGFSPNDNGDGDAWRPQFDISKPMRSVTLKIQDQAGKKTVAQLEGTAPDGSVRDLWWSGLSSKGAQLPEGYYRWTLSGRSADGDGTLVAGDGSSIVEGVIELIHR